jgi:hypothetical protein
MIVYTLRQRRCQGGRFRPGFCAKLRKKSYMTNDKHKKTGYPIASAHDEAEKDMSKDFELSDPDPTDDLDEGELARKDNSDEEALDNLERPRHQGQSGHAEKGGSGRAARGETHSGKGKEK